MIEGSTGAQRIRSVGALDSVVRDPAAMPQALQQLQVEIEQRFGMLPNFFRLAPESPEITMNLWGFARFAYLDNPLPSLFKERLFVYLSRFCTVRYCIARHVGFLVGLGHPAGDAQCAAQSVEDVIRLIRRPPARGEQLDVLVSQCHARGLISTELTADSPMEEAIFACAAHAFLQTPDAPRCLRALECALGAVRFQHLMVFLAFIRTAHYWSKVHTELTIEDDVLQLLAAHETLAECVLNDPEAGACDISQKLLDEFALLRQSKEQHDELARAHQALRESEAELRRTKETLSDFVENATVAMHWVAADGTILWANRAEMALLGYTRDEYIGHHIAEFHADPPVIADILRRLTSAETLREYPARLRHKDGSIRHVLINSNVLWEDGKFVHTRCLTRDVTERLSAQEALAEGARQKEALFQLTDRLQRARSLGDVYEAALQAILNALSCDRASILLFDEAGVMRFVAWRGLSDGYRDAVEGHSPWPQTEENPAPICIADTEAADLSDALKKTIREEGIGAAAFIPLVVDGVLVGKFMTYFNGPHAFGDDEIALSLTIARQLAFAIDRRRADDALRASERHFRQMIDALPAAIYTTDAKGRLTHFNPAAVEFSGRVPAIGTDEWCVSWKLYQPDGTPLPHAACPMAVSLKEGRAIRGAEAIAERPDGTRRWFTPYPTPLLDHDGRIVGGINMLVDITERKRAEEELRRRTAQYEALVDQAPVGIYLVDADFRIRQVNPVAQPVFGDIPDLIGRDFDEVVHALWPKDYADEIVRRFRHTLETGEPYIAPERVETRLDRGVTEYYEWRIDRMPLPEGRHGVVCYFRDIAAQVKARVMIAESEERFRTLVSVITDVPWTRDPVGRFVARQPAWERYTGQSWTEYRDFGWLNAFHPEDREYVSRAWKRACRERTTYEARGRLWHAPTRGHRYCLVRGTPVMNADDTVREWVGSCTDVNTQREAEEALREADRRKDEFLATLSHELRNPLAPIRQAAKLLNARGISERDAQWARDVIDRQVRAMGWLLDDLLDLSRIAQGKLVLRKESVDLADVVESAVETARPLIDAKRHALKIELPASPVRLEADPLRLAQIISNLLTNAAKYTDPRGRIRLRARRENDELILSVADTGIGLSADMLPQLFQMFSQVTPALERTEGGLGVGLALVRGFVTLHGGTVDARSDGPGRGSEFTLHLPLGVPSVQAAASISPASDPAACDGRKVLVVDDNRDTAETLAALLQMQGYDVRTTFDGQEALSVAELFHPDVVLLDIGMPKLNGYEAAQQIRKHLWGKRATLIAVTGWGQEDDKRRAMAAGFDFHLRKPVDFDVLRSLLAAPAEH